MYPLQPQFKPCKYLPKYMNISNYGTQGLPEKGAILLDFAEGYGIPINRRHKSIKPSFYNMNFVYNKCIYGNALYFNGISDVLEYNETELNFQPTDRFALNIRFRVVDFPPLGAPGEFNIGAIFAKIDIASNKGIYVMCATVNNDGEATYIIMCGINDGMDDEINVSTNVYIGSEKDLNFHHIIIANVIGLGTIVLYDDNFVDLYDVSSFTMVDTSIKIGGVKIEVGEDVFYGYVSNCEITNLAFVRQYNNPSTLG